MEENTQMLSMKSLEIGFGTVKRKTALLPPLNASAGRGELVSVIGQNGIGKSTMLRTIAGIQKPLSGEIMYGEIPVNSSSALAGLVSYISTETVKVSNMNVYDLVSLGRYPHTGWLGSMTDTDRRIILDAMEKTSVSSFARRYVAELSDGERQKAMIARVLAQDTPVMLMDEPTAFLDVRSKFEILHLLFDLTRKEHKTIIFTTHDLDLAARHADRIWLILPAGLFEGAPEDLMLKGLFDDLFKSSNVKFSAADGSYSISSEKKGEMFVEGSGKRFHWTARALKRIGYSVSLRKTDPYIRLSEDRWEYVSKDSGTEFDSIHALVAFIDGQTH